MKLKDTRTKLINEILNGIKVLKFNAWEEAFEQKVADVREQEVSMIKKTAYLMGGATISFTSAPLIVSKDLLYTSGMLTLFINKRKL